MSQITFHFNDLYKTQPIMDKVKINKDGWSKEKFSIYVTAYEKDDEEFICSFDVGYKHFKKKGLIFDFDFDNESGSLQLNVAGDAVMKLRPGVVHEIENAKGGAVYKAKWIRIKEKDEGPYNADLENEMQKVVENVEIN